MSGGGWNRFSGVPTGSLSTAALFYSGPRTTNGGTGSGEDLDALRANVAAAEARFRSGVERPSMCCACKVNWPVRRRSPHFWHRPLAAAQVAVNRTLGRDPGPPAPTHPFPLPPGVADDSHLVCTRHAPEAGLRVLDRERTAAAESSLTASRRQRRPDLGDSVSPVANIPGTARIPSGTVHAFGESPVVQSGAISARIFQQDEAQPEAVRLDTAGRRTGDSGRDLSVAHQLSRRRGEPPQLSQRNPAPNRGRRAAALSAWMSGRGS